MKAASLSLMVVLPASAAGKATTAVMVAGYLPVSSAFHVGGGIVVAVFTGFGEATSELLLQPAAANSKLQALLGTSPNEVIRQYRLQKATEHLAAGLDVSTAAYKTGFNSSSYFAQCFKEQYQISPTEWMAGLKKTTAGRD